MLLLRYYEAFVFLGIELSPFSVSDYGIKVENWAKTNKNRTYSKRKGTSKRFCQMVFNISLKIRKLVSVIKPIIHYNSDVKSAAGRFWKESACVYGVINSVKYDRALTHCFQMLSLLTAYPRVLRRPLISFSSWQTWLYIPNGKALRKSPADWESSIWQVFLQNEFWCQHQIQILAMLNQKRTGLWSIPILLQFTKMLNLLFESL